MYLLLYIWAVILAVADTRVTFPYSEVLQLNDLVNNEASFKCDDGCKVYVNRKDDDLRITQNGEYISSFTLIVGDDSFYPDFLFLDAGTNYTVQATHQPTVDFVLYAVSIKSPNFGTKVAAVYSVGGTGGGGNVAGLSQLTVLSSIPSIRLAAFEGIFEEGYPRVYSTGFDAVGDPSCRPVYQARSQYNAEMSMPAILSPIITVDFGASTETRLTVYADAYWYPFHSSRSSTVYMSPGYVGCEFVGAQMYYSGVKGQSDVFEISADSLDISAVYNAVSFKEIVEFRVNHDILDFFGTSSFTKNYTKGELEVILGWDRETPESSWAIQLDFYAAAITTTSVETSTSTSSTKTTTSPSPTTTSTTTKNTDTTTVRTVPPTTSGKESATGFLAIVVVALISF